MAITAPETEGLDMFTIKHVLPKGKEEIFEGTKPCFSPDPQDFEGALPGLFHFTDEKSIIHTINVGKVYVMNGTGSTIASYDLRPPAKAPLPTSC